MFKKIIAWMLLITVTATAAIGGTLAYLTDRDSEANVFTVGDVDIVLKEDFNQESELKPGVEINKDVQIENIGDNEAWVWYTYAVSQNLEAGLDLAFENTTDWTNEATAIGTKEVDGITYNVYVCKYNAKLPAGATTSVGLSGVTMDPAVDITPEGDAYLLVKGETTNLNWNVNENDKPVIFVNAYAIQTNEFDTFEDAYNAYIGQWGDMVEAGTYETWDGTADTSWYNETDTVFALTSPEQLAGLAELVDGGNNFAGKTIKLAHNMNLYAEDANGNRVPFNPIGHSAYGQSFNGTFDGQGHTISNMYQQSNLGAWQYEGQYYGLIAYTNGATIKNVTVSDAYVSSGRNEAAAVVGNAVNTTFDNITVSNTTLIAYNNSAGGVASECYGDCSFTNITVDEDTVIGPLWGTYDVRLGGVVGMVKSSDKVSFTNVNVACQLDAINDVAANYQYWLYRYSGMLIGHVDAVNGVADPTGYVTCENVTVTYGDWVNYHYCEDADLGAGSYNGPGEYKYARVEAGTGTNGIDLATCNHNADESHNVLIVFDQLFGGGQGVSGLKTYDGVTVVYPTNP